MVLYVASLLRVLHTARKQMHGTERFKHNVEYSPYAKVLVKRAVQPPQNQRDELLLPITPPPMGKTTRRELFQVEKGMIIALFWFFSQNLYY